MLEGEYTFPIIKDAKEPVTEGCLRFTIIFEGKQLLVDIPKKLKPMQVGTSFSFGCDVIVDDFGNVVEIEENEECYRTDKSGKG